MESCKIRCDAEARRWMDARYDAFSKTGNPVPAVSVEELSRLLYSVLAPMEAELRTANQGGRHEAEAAVPR